MREVAPEIRHFVFEVPELDELVFTPGQFVSLSDEVNGKKVTRAYSTAAQPAGNRFELCLNRVQDGLFSPFLFRLNPGDMVEMRGPLGYFTLRSLEREMIFVATGTGIAPFRGMLQQVLGSGSAAPVTLVFGVRFESSLMYRGEFEEAAAKHPNFRFVPVLSRPAEGWTGRTGHVQEHVLEVLGERRDVDVYICGLKAMVDDMRARLKDLGLDRKQIIFEKYD